MELLILPSHRLLFHHGDKLLLLPLKCEDYSSSGSFISMHHYKSAQIYRQSDIIESALKKHQINPVSLSNFLKKIQITNLTNKNGAYECLMVDKFGDIYRNKFQSDEIGNEYQYLNSNLGIPKYIKHIGMGQKQYLILGDEENKIKVYNSVNAHEIVSIWNMVNMVSVDFLECNNKGVLLMKYFDKISLKEDVDLHWFQLKNIEDEEYPGKPVKKMIKFDSALCRYFTVVKIEEEIVLLLLHQDRIIYEVFSQKEGEIQSVKIGQILIEKGHWNYLHTLNIKKGIIVSFGNQVQNPEGIAEEQWKITEEPISLNSYQKIIVINL